MAAVYNENDPYAAAWLENLAAGGHIAEGLVDSRDVHLLEPADVIGATQFHAFAGIGAWSYALRLAAWPDSTPVWTGSCPCQPFSTAGRRKGTKDDRHLWPEWHRLLAECLPTVVFGEQVASPAGRAWLAVVRDEMEALGYAVGAADLCAAGAGAPHIRQRLFFGAIRVVDPEDRQRDVRKPEARTESPGASRGRGTFDRVGNANGERGQGNSRAVSREKKEGKEQRGKARSLTHKPESSGNAGEPWKSAEWISCSDGKARPIEPGAFPLSYGPPSRVERLRTGKEKTVEQSRPGMIRGYGNAIVPQIAAVFIRSFISAYLDSTKASERTLTHVNSKCD